MDRPLLIYDEAELNSDAKYIAGPHLIVSVFKHNFSQKLA